MTRRVLVTGGAGFLGSHLCDALLSRGDTVVALDDLSSGRVANVAHLSGDPRFRLVEGDVTRPISIDGAVDLVLHFASPASPPRYVAMPIHTLLTGSAGTQHALELAERHGARMVMASTSEVYGDPQVSPQPESYWGNVNPVGARSCYDEAKRFAEALCTSWRTARGVDVGIIRIFNTYGPRLDPADGRAVSSFVHAALRGEPLVVNGDGTQTRSLCFVDDLVAGILAFADSRETGPVNLGSDAELTVLALAREVLRLTGSASSIRHVDALPDDPQQRRPDLALAAARLGWRPTTDLATGLARTISWMRDHPA